MATEPREYAWIIQGRLAVAERPGGGGRSHRIERRDGELAWWAAQGVDAIVSGMATRHGLLDAALAGFRVAWQPLVDPDQAARSLPSLVATVAALLDGGATVLVHVDRAGEWLAAVDAALRLRLGAATDVPSALRQVREDGLPVGPVTLAILDVPSPQIGASAGLAA